MTDKPFPATQYRISPIEMEAAHYAYRGSRPSDAIRQLIVDGLMLNLVDGTFSAKKISRQFLDSKKPHEIAPLFLRYIDAVYTENKTCLGPAQNTSRFEKVPEGTQYAEEGKEVYVVLELDEIMTADGSIIVKW